MRCSLQNSSRVGETWHAMLPAWESMSCTQELLQGCTKSKGFARHVYNATKATIGMVLIHLQITIIQGLSQLEARMMDGE
jgi:hypothetical protein